MGFLIRQLQRLAILGIGVLSVWLIVFVVFETADRRLPWILAVAATYAVAAYVVLPRAVLMALKIQHRKRVPAYTLTGDGLAGDPVNVALIGTRQQLCRAFASSGWTGSDRLGFASSVAMCRSFVMNRPYPTAPFSTLYLFGRGQDIGFQKPIGSSPRKRHHIRFWALGLHEARATVDTASFWLNTDRPQDDVPVLWVGAGTRDTGFGLTRLTFQITHATDSDTNAERDFIIEELNQGGLIADVRIHRTGDEIHGRVNHYRADGDVSVADLIDTAKESVGRSDGATEATEAAEIP